MTRRKYPIGPYEDNSRLGVFLTCLLSAVVLALGIAAVVALTGCTDNTEAPTERVIYVYVCPSPTPSPTEALPPPPLPTRVITVVPPVSTAQEPAATVPAAVPTAQSTTQPTIAPPPVPTAVPTFVPIPVRTRSTP